MPKKINLDELDPATRLKVDRLINPRDTVLSFMVTDLQAETWSVSAKVAGYPSLSDWIEFQLDTAVTAPVAEPQGPPLPMDVSMLDSDERSRVKRALTPLREYTMSRKFPEHKILMWRAAAIVAGAETVGRWIEWQLDAAAATAMKKAK